MMGMFQFTLKQLLLATACFSMGFAGVVMARENGAENWTWVPKFYVAECGFICGIGVLRGDFWCYLLAAIVGPPLLVLTLLLLVLPFMR
jgi:hypothetical protein